MKKFLVFVFAVSLMAAVSFSFKPQDNAASPAPAADSTFQVVSEQFADLRVLRYQVPGFEELTPKQKELVYYLYEAALSGRDMIWDQNGKYNLTIRHLLEAIVRSGKVDTTTQDGREFMIYTKRVWFANGLYHHYGNDKLQPNFSPDYFTKLVKSLTPFELPTAKGETADALLDKLIPVMFDKNVLPKKVNKDPKVDMIQTSATGFYDGVTQQEVSDYYKALSATQKTNAPMWGLNSRVVKIDGKVTEKTWKVGGMYDGCISRIVGWLQKASTVAENPTQKKAIDALIAFYQTGDLKKFDEYNIAWVADSTSRVDFVNGFIEVYGDPLGYKGSYESMVSIRDMEASKRIAAIGGSAQWFEDNSPLMPAHKKKNVKGISAKVITVVVESGDASPSTPIGVNLPNSNWIREQYGSKSVNLGNIVNAYNRAKGAGMVKEFYFSEDMRERAMKYGVLCGNLHTDMHEVIGHASGQLNPGVAEPHTTLKNYASTLEEARADLVGLYYLMDKKLIDIGVMNTLDVGKTQYDNYIMNGMMLQLSRLKPGDDIEEDHMRNRQLVAKWAFERGAKENVIEKKVVDGKTYFVVNDDNKLRGYFGELLREIQRIKSEGDYKAAHDLVETYGVKVDPALHKEMLERYKKLNVAPYQGFINPKLVPVMENGVMKDVRIEYPSNFTQQMLEYGKNYGFLPLNN